MLAFWQHNNKISELFPTAFSAMIKRDEIHDSVYKLYKQDFFVHWHHFQCPSATKFHNIPLQPKDIHLISYPLKIFQLAKQPKWKFHKFSPQPTFGLARQEITIYVIKIHREFCSCFRNGLPDFVRVLFRLCMIWWIENFICDFYYCMKSHAALNSSKSSQHTNWCHSTYLHDHQQLSGDSTPKCCKRELCTLVLCCHTGGCGSKFCHDA